MNDETGMHHEVKAKPSRPEIFAMGLLSLVSLAAGVLIAYLFGSFAMRSPEHGGTSMPRGMVMQRNASTEQMTDMQAVDERQASYDAPSDAQGNHELQPQIVDGVKVFHLDVSIIKWHILPGRTVLAYAYNRQVPGPKIHVRQGDHVRIIVRNDLRGESTTVHWHGLDVPNAMDGAAGITQAPIAPGHSFTYEFTVEQSGTYFYHSHDHPDRQEALGLYGAFIVDPPKPAYRYDVATDVELGEWLWRDGLTYPAMPMEGSMPNFFTINGKAYPATPTIHVRLGQRLLIRFIGTNSGFIHPMHVHGGPFRIVAIDGSALPSSQQYDRDTVNVAPGERYDAIWTARRPGKWLLHCHINHHITNDGVEEQGGGGLTEIIQVD